MENVENKDINNNENKEIKNPENKETKNSKKKEMKKNEENLQNMLKEAEEKLNNKEILIENAGSIAEASLALNDVFGAAQRSVDTYLQSIKAKYSAMQKKCETVENERRQILNIAQLQADIILKKAEEESARMIEEAKADIDRREKEFQQAVSKMIDANSELKKLLGQEK